MTRHCRDEAALPPVTVLVTNDDGVASPGLAALVRAVTAPGRRVIVAAPAEDQSGTSAAVAPRPPEGVRIEPVTVAGAEGVTAFAVAGPPALAVLGARIGELGEEAAAATVVASGVNLGPNTGIALLFSGTVGAAMAASTLGLSALAVSINSFRPGHLDTATFVAGAALDWLLDAPAGTVLNVNVPDRPLDGLAGIRQAPLATFGTVEAAVRKLEGGPFHAQFQLRAPQGEPGTDDALLRDGWVTVTSLTGIRAVDGDIEVASFIEHAVSSAA